MGLGQQPDGQTPPRSEKFLFGKNSFPALASRPAANRKRCRSQMGKKDKSEKKKEVEDDDDAEDGSKKQVFLSPIASPLAGKKLTKKAPPRLRA